MNSIVHILQDTIKTHRSTALIMALCVSIKLGMSNLNLMWIILRVLVQILQLKVLIAYSKKLFKPHETAHLSH